MRKNHLIYRSLSLAKVLWVGAFWLRVVFVSLVCMWCLAALFYLANISVPKMAAVLSVPGLLQLVVVMSMGYRGSQLLMNSQLHLVGIRKELFLNSAFLCLLFSLCFFDPKNADNLVNAKFLMFAIYSVSFFWMFWFYCLQLFSLLVVALITTGCIFLIFWIGVKPALLIFSVSLWGYFAFWLSRGKLQRQFKFDNFSNVVDYCVERLKLENLKKALTKVNCKEHVILMGEGDGYLNRIILSPIFTLLFTTFYVVAMRNMRELSLWMIFLLLGGGKPRIKVVQSQAKLWLLSGNSRLEQFYITENLLLKLALYALIPASLLLVIWCQINPELARYGVMGFLLSLLCVMVLDYFAGFIYPGARIFFLIFVFIKMAIMFAFIFLRVETEWYALMAVILIGLLMLARRHAKKNFLVGNLSVRAQ